MPVFASHDGLLLSYHADGVGDPLVCLPGGPMRDSAYLGDLGGLSSHRRLIRLDLRGTGSSASPQDEQSNRCDRLAEDVEALRLHLGAEQLSILAHSAGSNLALQYLTRYPDRVRELILVTPSLAAAGLEVTPAMRLAAARTRSGEEWFDSAFTALNRALTGNGDASTPEDLAPFAYGRWDGTARQHHKSGKTQINTAAAAMFGSGGAFNPEATRAAMAHYNGPVTVLAGSMDLNSPLPAVRQLAGFFPLARLIELPGGAHFPWLDTRDEFLDALTARSPEASAVCR
jgi:pimeloyl-ACP methyl ester carboxylesterase